MASDHLDRLTSVDASFLAQEKQGSHMHIGGVMIFEGPPPGHEELIEHIDSRLHLVPRYRQKLVFPRYEMGRPLWVDDPSFNIEYHLRHTALPAPGSEEQLRKLVGRVFSQRLDRSKPLWELWLVQGLEGNRFALLNKTHHALVDGVSGVDLTTVLFDTQPVPADVAAPERRWTPRPEPSEAEIVARGVRDVVAIPVGLARRALGVVQDPVGAVDEAREAVAGVAEVLWGVVTRAPENLLNRPIGTHRRVLWLRTPLADLKEVKNSLGGTVNDVFLAVVTGALARWMKGRGVRTEGLELRGAVPVSVRSDDQRAEFGNRITVMVGRLPVYCEDPVDRLRIVSDQMQDLKESRQALGAEVIIGLENFAPPTVFAQASRLHFSNRAYNLLVTNVPGPQFPLYLLGRELEELAPVAFLAPNQALAIAFMSYNGNVDIGLIGDYDAMPDLDELGEHCEQAIAELVEAARKTEAGSLSA